MPFGCKSFSKGLFYLVAYIVIVVIGSCFGILVERKCKQMLFFSEDRLIHSLSVIYWLMCTISAGWIRDPLVAPQICLGAGSCKGEQAPSSPLLSAEGYSEVSGARSLELWIGRHSVSAAADHSTLWSIGCPPSNGPGQPPFAVPPGCHTCKTDP